MVWKYARSKTLAPRPMKPKMSARKSRVKEMGADEDADDHPHHPHADHRLAHY
jgi:hypothetical protein